MLEKRILIVRHCESIANEQSLIAGSLDSPLSEFGSLQAYATGFDIWYRKEKVQALYASTLTRAYQTAQGIQHYYRDLDIQRCASLNEMCFGDAEGHKTTDLQGEYKDAIEEWNRLGYPVHLPGQESRECVVARAKSAIADIARKEKDADTICIVTHGMLIRLLVADILGITDNVREKVQLQDNGKYIVVMYNPYSGTLRLENEINRFA